MALLVAACASDPDRPTIWPPPDFEVVVEEASILGAEFRVERRFRVRADGLASFAAAGEPVVDPETGTRLPVWSRLSIYRLVPTCTRALARRIHRAGVLELDAAQGQRDGDVEVGARLTWRAFDRRVVVTSRGRVHGPMAEILAIVAAHLPEGEMLSTPGVSERGVASVLRGVPPPRDDAAGALAVHLDLLELSPDDGTMLLDAFALACRAGRRQLAESLLGRWEASVSEPPAVEPPADGPQLTPAILRRMLPAD